LTNNLNVDGMAGQVRDIIISHVKGMRKVWGATPEAEQQALIDTITGSSVDLVEDMIDVVSAEGAVSISASVQNVTVKQDAVSGTVTIDRDDDDADSFIHAAHKPCKLTFFKSRDKILSTGDDAKPDPDQNQMFSDDDPLHHPDGRVNDPEDNVRTLHVPAKSEPMEESAKKKEPVKKGPRRRKSSKKSDLIKVTDSPGLRVTKVEDTTTSEEDLIEQPSGDVDDVDLAGNS